jgi:hypothetical protein
MILCIIILSKDTIKGFTLRRELIADLQDRAECYFKDELVNIIKERNGITLCFTEEEYATQFIYENEKIKDKFYLKYEQISFTILDNKKHLKLSY